MHHPVLRSLASLLIAAALCGPAAAQDEFSTDDVLNGTKSSQETCTGSAVWVVVQDQGDCIVYYAGGLQAQNPTAVVFFQGDLINRQWDPQGKTVNQTVFAAYGTDSPALEARAARRSAPRP